MNIILGQELGIVIDIGHGGNDSGAVGINEIQEKDVVMKIVFQIFYINKPLKTLLISISPVLEKTVIFFFRYRTRAKLRQCFKGNIFISLQCGSFGLIQYRELLKCIFGKTVSNYLKESICLAYQ